MEAEPVTMLEGELRRLVRQVRVRPPGAAAGERDPKSLRPLLNRRGRITRMRHACARLALWGRRRIEQKGSERDVELVGLLEPLDLDEADVAPGSDEIGEDQQWDG